MFESYTSDSTPAESFLAQIAGPTRAAAIMGDLDELAANRGRFWFWIAYIRTLVSLGWRTLAAFVVGFTSFLLMMSFLGVWMRIPKAIDNMAFGSTHNALTFLSTAFLSIFASSLWFAAPYAFLRFGHRDRMVQLYCVFFLLTTPFLFHSNSISLIFALVTFALIIAALWSSVWRRPMIVLAATSITALVALEATTDLVTRVYHPYFHYPHEFNLTSWAVVRLTAAVALANAAILCTWLHRRLLRQSTAIA